MGTVQRRSNIELLRIISMIMIIAHHFSIHGGFYYSGDTLSVNRLWVQFLSMGGKVGVDIFVFISGYFLVKSANIKISRTLKLWIQLASYSVLFYMAWAIVKTHGIGGGIRAIIGSAMPVITNEWWFATTYFILYLFSPFINRSLRMLSRNQYKTMLGIMTVCWCIIPTFLNVNVQYSELAWFVYLYSVAGYIRLWRDEEKLKDRNCFIFAGAMAAVMYGATISCDVLGVRYEVFRRYIGYFNGMNMLPAFLLALALFLGFKNCDINYSKTINTVASATFGVYLIHDSNYMRPFLWKIVFRNAEFAESRFLIPYSVFVILLVFVVCAAVELVRINFIEKYYMKLILKWEPKLIALKEKVFNLPLLKNL